MTKHQVTFNLVGTRIDYLKIALSFFKAAILGKKEVWFNEAPCDGISIDGEDV